MQKALNNRSQFGLSGGSSLNILVRPPKLPGIDGSNVKLGPGPARQRATSAPCPVPHRLPNLGPLAAARPCCVTAAQPRLHSVHGMRAEHPKQYFLTGREHMDLLFFSNEVIAIPPPRYCERLLPTKLGAPLSNKRRAPPPSPKKLDFGYPDVVSFPPRKSFILKQTVLRRNIDS